MPQRTNPFQELVHLVELAFAGPEDKVTASVMETGQGLETEREIDIRRETSNGLYKIKVAVEAKDEGRPWEVTKVEQYLGKYRGEGRVVVDKSVLVSRQGFTTGAIEKARAADVVLLTLDEAKDFDWTKLGPKFGPLTKETTLHVRFAPHVCKIIFDPPIPDCTFREKANADGRMTVAW
jgi:Restriction endonuclease